MNLGFIAGWAGLGLAGWLDPLSSWPGDGLAGEADGLYSTHILTTQHREPRTPDTREVHRTLHRDTGEPIRPIHHPGTPQPIKYKVGRNWLTGKSGDAEPLATNIGSSVALLSLSTGYKRKITALIETG